MKTASVSELKARISAYLRWVKRGGEVEILERGVPVARLVPVAGSDRGRRQRLAAAGIVRLGSGDASWILGEPRPRGLRLREALEEEREDRI
jgi:prevent-host-death family protein